MKKYLFYPVLFFIAILITSGCSSTVDNRITFKNMAWGELNINFRGDVIRVAPNKSVSLNNIQKGKYSYTTTYEVPQDTKSTTAEGAVSGDIEVKAGTKILVMYSSTMFEGVYTIYASYSSSDDMTVDEDTP